MGIPIEDRTAEYLRHRGSLEAYAKRGLALKAAATPLLIAGLIFGYSAACKTILLMTIAVSASLWMLETVWRSFGRFHRDQMMRNASASVAETEERKADWACERGAWHRFLLGPYAALIYSFIILIGTAGILLSPGPEMTDRQAGSPACCCTECPLGETTSGPASSADSDLTKKPETPPASGDSPAPPPQGGGEGERTAGINWLVPLGAGAAAAAWYFCSVWLKAGCEQASPSPSHIYDMRMSIPMAAVTALTAFGVAWTSIGAKDVLGLWCLPLLMIPPVMMLPWLFPAKRRIISWGLPVSLMLAIIAISVYLMIDRPLPDHISQWPAYLGTLAWTFIPNDLRDGVSIAVAYIAYIAALFGALLSAGAPGNQAP